nr:unnamed protein product [Spirometra erinaceieuropaei]
MFPTLYGVPCASRRKRASSDATCKAFCSLDTYMKNGAIMEAGKASPHVGVEFLPTKALNGSINVRKLLRLVDDKAIFPEE